MSEQRSSPAQPPRLAAAILVATWLAVAAPAAAEEPGAHDFGTSIVLFTLEYEDDLLPAPPWALARARTSRLGNVFFLTGVEPEPARGAAKRHWIPLADVVRIAEYDDVAAAREALEEGVMEEGDERPVVRTIRTSPRR